MCLLVKKRRFQKELKFKKAKKDIVCYKVVKKNYNEFATNNTIYSSPYSSPYLGFNIELNKHYENNDRLALSGDRFYFDNYPKMFAVTSGVFHTFRKYNEAYQSLISMVGGGRVKPYTMRILKAIIPKGTEYLVSKDKTEYGSKSIIYLNEE